jgi:hypothetical protein
MTNISNINEGFNSSLSLRPLVEVIKKMTSSNMPGARKLYQKLLEEIEAAPELLAPLQSPEALLKHKDLAETLLSTIFAPSTASMQGMYAISFPFRSETIYASPAFKELFLKEGSARITVPNHRTNINISKATLNLAYKLILKKFYGFQAPVIASSVHPFTGKDIKLTKYYELKLNAQFVDVKVTNENFVLPQNVSPAIITDLEQLEELLPIANFSFDGIVVIDVVDVTAEQVISEIKTLLLNINAFSDVTVYNELQLHLQSLVELPDVKIGITPFFKLNQFYMYTEAHYQNSLLFKNEEVIRNKDRISEICQKVFRFTNNPLLLNRLQDTNEANHEIFQLYASLGAENLVLFPLKSDDGQLIGLLEILSEKEDTIQYEHINRLQAAIPLFSLALGITYESLELQIDKTIKEHFTAVQPAVEWKFTEAAFQYLQHSQQTELAKMPNISFEEVYPLYGAIDVRNSSSERNTAIQKDLLEQLNHAKSVLENASKLMDFPLLKETVYRIDKYIEAASDSLLSDDEMIIYDFLQNDLENLLDHLRIIKPELKKNIEGYFKTIDPQKKVLYKNRKEYEESLTRINDVLDRFIDSEQQSAQDIYPHYFERYITDGLEFNIYVGQSLAPHHPFDEIYVRNLKLWQLTFLAKAARLTNALEKKLSLPLRTTQLILAHSIPLSISFRKKERKFDVDGAYNIRYEIIKKRIDKVHIKDSEERLTQPGTISIVYSQHKELQEYMEYVEFLQNENLLGKNLEHFDLEDTQGISGLKAIRVDVNLENDISLPSKVELSKTTSEKLLRK